MAKERKSSADKASLNMQLDASLLRDAHEMAEEDGISLSGLVRMLLIREKKRRDEEFAEQRRRKLQALTFEESGSKENAS